MNERDQDTIFFSGDGKQLAGTIANTLSDVFTSLHDTKRQVGQGLENAFMGIANDVAGLQGQIVTTIEQVLMDACQKTAQTQAQIPHVIEQQLGAVGGTLNLIDSALARNKKRLQRLQGPTIKGTADAVGGGVPLSPQSATVSQTPPPSSQAPGAAPDNSILQSFVPFPPAPTQPDLQTLVMPTATPGSYVGLAQLPPQIWDKTNDMGIFLSLVPTPLTQGQVAIQNDENGRFVDAGFVFLNLATEAARPQLQTLIQTLGLPQSSVTLLSPQDAYNAAVSVFSEPVVQSTYSVYNLPLPPIQQAPQTLPPFDSLPTSAPGAETAFTSTPALPAAPGASGAIPGVPDGCPPPPCPKIEFTGLNDLTDWLLPRLQLPTFDQVCERLNPVYDYLGVPAGARPPCSSMQDLVNELKRRYGAGT